MRYARAKWLENQKELSYRIYITDSLFLMGQNKAFTQRWIEIIKPEPVDTRTGNEIAEDFIKRAGLKVK